MSAPSIPQAHAGATRRTVLLLILLIIACGIAAGAYLEAGDPRFALATVGIIGERHTAQTDILDAAALPKGANIWLLDLASARRRVEALPWVATASFHRFWPNRLLITVVERAPVARVAMPLAAAGEEPAPGLALIDATLRVLAYVPASTARDLPLFRVDPPMAPIAPGLTIAGSPVQDAYDAMVQLRALGLRISEVDLKPASGVTVIIDSGLHVILGSDGDFGEKVTLLRAIAPKIASPERVVYVDLRSVRAPTVLYR